MHIYWSVWRSHIPRKGTDGLPDLVAREETPRACAGTSMGEGSLCVAYLQIRRWRILSKTMVPGRLDPTAVNLHNETSSQRTEIAHSAAWWLHCLAEGKGYLSRDETSTLSPSKVRSIKERS